MSDQPFAHWEVPDGTPLPSAGAPSGKQAQRERWLWHGVRRARVPQQDHGYVDLTELRIGRWRFGFGIASRLPRAPWYTRYVYAWRHPGVLYPPHFQLRVWRTMIGFTRFASPNTEAQPPKVG